MGRDKLKRNLQFKPRCIRFTTACENNNTIQLLHEEMEALYLMDAKELYQADAAKEMGVSRPTFARIIKHARQKVTMMLITGASLEIIDEKEDIMVMVPSYETDTIVQSKPNAPFLVIYHIENKKVLQRGIMENPVYKTDARPGQVLPQICSKEGINYFVAEEIGIGLKNALLSKGVFSMIEESLSEEKILSLTSRINNR